MLTIRMQRTGRSGHAQFRVVVQDSRFHPTRGRVVAYAGSYNPHDKSATLDTEVIAKYLDNGAQPSDRVARLLQKEGVKLPTWVKLSEGSKKRDIRNPEKLRRNRPAEEPVATEEATPADSTEAPAEEAPATEQPETTEETSQDAPAESEAPAEEPASEQ